MSRQSPIALLKQTSAYTSLRPSHKFLFSRRSIRWESSQSQKPSIPIPPQGWIPPRRPPIRADFPKTRIVVGVLFTGYMLYVMVRSACAYTFSPSN